MREAASLPSDAERFTWLERPDDDFPYYRGAPVEISGMQWLVVLIATAIGLSALLFLPLLLHGPLTQFIPVVLLSAIPLLALAWVAPNGWTAIFRRLRISDFFWMIAFAIINIVVTLAVGAIMVNLIETTRNAGVAGLADQGSFERIMFFVRSVPQLFGEEVFSILPFLAMLWLFTRWGVSRKIAIVLAALVTGVIFALVHLETYGWNLVQALGGVGVIRLILLAPYIMTKNIWVSTGTHILNDWFNFGFSLVGAGVAAQGGAT